MFLSKIQENHKTFQKKKGSLEETGPSFDQKLVCSEQSRTVYLGGKYWTGLESLNIYFCVLSDCYCQSLIPGREAGH